MNYCSISALRAGTGADRMCVCVCVFVCARRTLKYEFDTVSDKPMKVCAWMPGRLNSSCHICHRTVVLGHHIHILACKDGRSVGSVCTMKCYTHRLAHALHIVRARCIRKYEWNIRLSLPIRYRFWAPDRVPRMNTDACIQCQIIGLEITYCRYLSILYMYYLLYIRCAVHTTCGRESEPCAGRKIMAIDRPTGRSGCLENRSILYDTADRWESYTKLYSYIW